MITKEYVMDRSAGSKLCLACSKLAPYIADQEEWHRNRCGLASKTNFRRIHIIGGPGSGKTTLARNIGGCLGIEVHELDQVAFAGRDFTERPFPDRVTDIGQIADRPAWITEGLFVQWTEKLLEQADIVVWLDHVTWERGILRITRRFVRSAVHEAQRRQGLHKFTRFQDYARHFKQFIQVIFSSRAYYTGRPAQHGGRLESRLSTATYLAAHSQKVIHCYNDEAVEIFIDYIRFCQENGGQGNSV